jgi:hypothetical protein
MRNRDVTFRYIDAPTGYGSVTDGGDTSGGSAPGIHVSGNHPGRRAARWAGSPQALGPLGFALGAGRPDAAPVALLLGVVIGTLLGLLLAPRG